jgi:hypothetical protein
MTLRLLWCLAALAFPLVAGGCGGKRLVSVSGRVTYQGRPVPSTLVTFQPADGSRPSKGVTDDDGRFTLRYSRTEAGASRGKCTAFLTYVVSNEEELHQAPPKASKELKEVIARYGDPEKSSLHYDVTKDGQVVEITLE